MKSACVAYPKRSLVSLGGKLKVWRKLPALIAIPTTAGTGSETTLAAMVTDPETHRKYAIMSFPIIPRYAVLDATRLIFENVQTAYADGTNSKARENMRNARQIRFILCRNS